MIRTRDDIPKLLEMLGLEGNGVEVGTFRGEYAAKLLETWPGHLTVIDPWVNLPDEEYLDGCNKYPMGVAYTEAMAALKPFSDQVNVKRMKSDEAVKLFADNSLDFVYLDGNHDLAHITQDINAWWPKVREGGILAGHDYLDKETDAWRCYVKTAVDSFSQDNNIAPLITIEPVPSWILLKLS